MSVFSSIQAQGRAVQLQLRSVPGIHHAADGTCTPIVVIPGAVAVGRDDQGAVREDLEEMWAEIPKATEEQGVAEIGTQDFVTCLELKWGVSAIDRGALGMHYVKLQREVRRMNAGQRQFRR